MNCHVEYRENRSRDQVSMEKKGHWLYKEKKNHLKGNLEDAGDELYPL